MLKSLYYEKKQAIKDCKKLFLKESPTIFAFGELSHLS